MQGLILQIPRRLNLAFVQAVNILFPEQQHAVAALVQVRPEQGKIGVRGRQFGSDIPHLQGQQTLRSETLRGHAQDTFSFRQPVGATLKRQLRFMAVFRRQ